MIDPLKAFGNASMAATFWFFVSVILIGVIIVQPIVIVDLMKAKKQYVALDPSGTFYIAPTKNFNEMREMHEYCTELVTTSLLMIGPKGYDNEALLKNIMTDGALTKAYSDFEIIKKRFDQYSLHQKVESKNISITQTSDSHIIAEITGQIIQNGVFESSNFFDIFKFKMIVRMDENNRIGHSKHLPMLVSNFDIKYEKIK
jgi:hypothetical protein